MKAVRGVGGKSAVRARCYWPPTGPPIYALGIHFCVENAENLFRNIWKR